jgi:predicted metal-dependent hydrolase
MHPLLQFTLNLFESNQPLGPVDHAQTAPEKIAITAQDSAPPLARPTETSSLRHPRANREARLHATVVAYEFKRGKRRSIGFSVGPQGLVVRAPQWVALKQVDAALQEKANWILQKLGETAQRHQKQAERQIEWRHGAIIPFLGEALTLVLESPSVSGAVPTGGRAARMVAVVLHRSPADSDSGAPAAARLQVALPGSATPEQVRAAVQVWLMREAKRLFRERLDHFAPQLQVQWRSLALSNARTRWGSARMDGAIRLNWRLIHFQQTVIDYVVAHELSHLREMNHSPRFWDTVRSVVPDYAALRLQLKDEVAPR